MISFFALLAVAAAALLLTRKPAGGAPPSATLAPEPSPGAPPDPRFQLGQRVQAASGREGMVVAREFGKFQAGFWHYLLEGSSTWLREDALEPVSEGAPTPPPAPTEEPASPARWAIGDQVVTTDGRTGPVSASHWDRHVPAWLYQVGNWSTWYQEASLSTPAPEPPSVPPSPAPVLPGTNQPAVRPGAVGMTLVLNEVAWRGSDAQTQLALAQRRWGQKRADYESMIRSRVNLENLWAQVSTAEETIRRRQAELRSGRFQGDPEQEIRELQAFLERVRPELAQAEAQADRLLRLLPLQLNTELAIIKSEVGVAINTADAIARFGARTGGYRDSI